MRPRFPALLLIFALAASAQTPPRSSVQGSVLDASGLPLDDVQVELLSLATGRIRSLRTDQTGRFAFQDLDSARYSLSFFRDGYAAVKQPPVELLPGSPLELTVRLERLGPPLARPTAGIQTIALEYGLVREQIAAAPMLLGSEGRTAVDKLALLVPGLTPVEAIEINPFSGVAAATSANGSRRSAINYQFDGANNNAQNRVTGAQAATFAPTPDAIETFRAVTHTYSARDGRNAGAVLSATSRSGDANWHGQVRGIVRPFQNPLASFDGSTDSLGGWAAGGQIGGPLWNKRRLFFFGDFEGWRTTQQHTQTTSVFSMAERTGDLSSLGQTVVDPLTNAPFPDNVIPATRLDPLMQKYLDAFVPLPNVGDSQARFRSDLPSRGKTSVGRIDFKPGDWTFTLSHLYYRADVLTPIGDDVIAPSPGVSESRRQLSNNMQFAATWSPGARFTQTTRVAGQRLSIARWQGRQDYRGMTADELGFDFSSYGYEPGTIPDVTLYDDQGFVRMHIAPFLFSENSAQTTYQLSHDAEVRLGRQTFRGGVLYQHGLWPFNNTENFAGSFSFPGPPEPPIRSRPNGLRDLLLGLPSEYRLQTPRSLDLRWREFAAYGQAELQPLRTLRITIGLRAESQPPAYDRFDRIGAFRPGLTSERFPTQQIGLIFPGDTDGDNGVLPRATVDYPGVNVGPRVGLAYSSGSDNPVARWLLGPSGRSVIRASYGLFYDFGAFAGSSAAALFQANYPPFSTVNAYDLSAFTRFSDTFESPLASAPGAQRPDIVSTIVRYPFLVFDRDFQNARAHQWNLGFQRLLPGGVFVSAIYVGSRSLKLQRQRELNEFIRNPLRGFAFVRSMRRYSRYTDIRQFESTGSGRYNGLQLRANRYLRRGLAFDVGYSWSRSDDNSSQLLGGELVTEPWSVSNFDRRQNLTATWTWEMRIPRSWSDRYPWLDRWTLAGVMRARSGLPLDIRQNEDPTFTFESIGRPDVLAPFRPLDPSKIRTFTYADGRTVTGRFAFDPTIFQAVKPTDFDETRPGNISRNEFRMRGYRQWDLRVARPFSVTEDLSMQLGFDMINVLGARNWAAPFGNIDHPYFGVVRTEGVRRTFQAVVRVEF
ncbi:MAG: carboxypeptidase regulatory-like domain-containing protein [Acidobacteria bacterium]|nr:carboxypeptidase regulatory-like domain-containing protein [Acidobacteriota bacterium]